MKKEELSRVLTMLAMDGDNASEVRDNGAVIQRSMDVALNAFYGDMPKVPEASDHFPSEDLKSSARQRQEKHWARILKLDFGEDFLNSATRIGRTHADLGLPADVYISGY